MCVYMCVCMICVCVRCARAPEVLGYAMCGSREKGGLHECVR